MTVLANSTFEGMFRFFKHERWSIFPCIGYLGHPFKKRLFEKERTFPLCLRTKEGERKIGSGVNPFDRTRGQVNFSIMRHKLPRTQQAADILNWNGVFSDYTPPQ